MRTAYKKKQNKKAFLYPDEASKLLDNLNERQKFTVLLLLNTGARIDEARHIEKIDIDHQRKNIYLKKTKVRAKQGETRSVPRIIPISSKFYKYLNKNIDKYKILGTDRVGKMLKSKGTQLKFKHAEDLSAHNLRKTFGTWMLALNVDANKLALHLGHTPQVLLKDYASGDIFDYKDKDIMREILDDLPSRMRS